MKIVIVAGLLALAVSVLDGGPPASAKKTSPETEFTGWLCEIDTTEIQNPPPNIPSSVFTFDSRKVCTGSNPDENIRVECRATIPNWTGSSSTNKDVSCQINRSQCGTNDFVFATGSSLNINSKGEARLNCKFNP
jgi:hypothetical protein